MAALCAGRVEWRDDSRPIVAELEEAKGEAEDDAPGLVVDVGAAPSVALGSAPSSAQLGAPRSREWCLGCTSPQLGEEETCIFVADGRFHPEAVLIANPTLPLHRGRCMRAEAPRRRAGMPPSKQP